jgi:hypothetical protein
MPSSSALKETWTDNFLTDNISPHFLYTFNEPVIESHNLKAQQLAWNTNNCHQLMDFITDCVTRLWTLLLKPFNWHN